jgi:hypothetical protein
LNLEILKREAFDEVKFLNHTISINNKNKMNKKFTKLMAALALLLFMTPAMVGWGQTRESVTVSYGWEDGDDANQWTISEAIVKTSGQGNTGTYAGKINTNTTYVQYKEKVNVTSFSYAFKRTSNNNNYSVYIQTSTDGQSWTTVDTQAMNTFNNGSYKTVTKTFDGNTACYVRFNCSNTTAVRYVDDVTITYNTTAATTYTVTYDCNGGESGCPTNITDIEPGTSITLADAPTKPHYNFNGWKSGEITYNAGASYTVNSNVTFTAQWESDGTYGEGSICFSNQSSCTAINSQSVTGNDDLGNTWTITTVGTSSFTANSGYYQVGSGNSPASSITFTTTLNEEVNVTDFSATFGGFSATRASVVLKVDDTQVGSGSLNGSADVTVSSSSAQIGTTLTVIVTPTAGGVKCYNISYAYETIATSAVATTTTINVPQNFNTDIYQGTSAGTLTATVKDNEDNTISGATVTWSSSNPSVATIASDGAVTLVAVGTTTITASYAGVEDQYRPSSDTYELVVIDSSPLANIAALTAQSAGTYNVTLTNALVTYVNGTNAYLEDASGAVLLYHCAGTLAAGDKITGTANVTYTVYNNLPEVTAIELAADYTLTSGNTVTPVVVTIAELNSNFNSYISRYVKIENATVTSAFSNKNCTIEQNGSSIILRDQNSTATLTTTTNSTVTVTAHPSIYNTTKQIAVYEQSQIVVIPTVYISANDVNITSSATSGSITYTIEHEPSPAGTLTVTVVSGYTISNLSLGTPSNGTIGFTCDANTTTTARTAEITLTYTYGSKAQVTKTITITQAAYVPAPTSDPFVRISSIDQLTDGSIVVIASRYNTTATDYYAMGNTLSNNKFPGTAFVSSSEMLPTTITNSIASYYWTVSITSVDNVNHYTFTNANGDVVGWLASTNFLLGNENANNEWTISTGTSGSNSLVAEYSAFNIKNANTSSRAFAFRHSETTSVFGPYAISGSNNNSNNGEYNFSLDFFVQTSTPVTETYHKTITAYYDTDGHTIKGGYYLIASPIGDVAPAQVEHMLTDDETVGETTSHTFDLYGFDPTQTLEWRNYRQGAFNLDAGKGYLYGNINDVDLVFTGTAYPVDEDIEVKLTKFEAEPGDGHDFPDWNLVGNPFAVTAYITKPYYKMNEGGTEIISVTGNSVEAMEGIFVVASYNNEPLTFSTTNSNGNGSSLSLNLTNGGSLIDRAIVSFVEGEQLPKFQLNRNSTKLYIPQDGQDYAIVCSEGMGAMPVNFKAENNGTYSLNFSTENVGFAYLHLIDNMTGRDIDLLQTPSYTFNAKTTDYASRFKLVFATGDNSNDNNFAFFSNGSFVINNDGAATLQVIDITGRIVKSESINGCTSVNVNAAPGVYMLRLVNGDNVKVQKVVVK